MLRTKLPFIFVVGIISLGFLLISKTEGGEKFKKITWGTPAHIEMQTIPFWIGADKGFFRNEGIDLDIILMKTSIQLAGIASGSLDYASSAGDTIRAAAMGVPIKLVFVSARYLPQLLVARPEINSVKDLKGKVIGVTNLLSSTYFAAYYILKAHGLDLERDVTLLPVGPGGMVLSSLLGGTVVASMITPDQFLIARQKGFKQLAKASDFIKIPSIGIAANNKKIREKRDEVKRMVRAALKSFLYVRTNKKETVDFLIKEGKIDPEGAPIIYDMGLDTYSKDGTVPDEALEQQIEIARKTGDVKGSVPLSRVVDFSILREVLKELGLSSW